MLSDDLGDADKALLKGIAARREGTQLCFYEPARLLSEDVLRAIDKSLNTNRTHVTIAAFYRLLAADLLPQDVHRALYLDGDVLCTGSLEELFSLDLKGSPVGMCIERENAHIYAYNRLGYPPHEGYFNSGVMLFDLDAWRRENIIRAMLGYLERNAKRLYWHDQDVINAVLHGKIFQLDFSYNLMVTCFYVFYWLKEESNNYYAQDTQYLPKDEWPALLAGVESPRLIHFWGIKPWYRDCLHPFAPVWRYFYAQSPWAKERLKYKYSPVKANIKRLGRKVLERLNLVAPSAAIPYPQEAFKAARRVLDELKGE